MDHMYRWETVRAVTAQRVFGIVRTPALRRPSSRPAPYWTPGCGPWRSPSPPRAHCGRWRS